MKTILIIGALIYSAITISCEVQLPSHVLILGAEERLNVVQQQTGCSEELLLDLNQTIASIDGRIASSQLRAMLATKNHELMIKPMQIRVQHLKNLVRDQLNLPAGVQMKSSALASAQNTVSLNEGDRVQIDCENCLFGQRQPLEIRISGLDGSVRNLTVTAEFRRMIKAFRYANSLPAFSTVQESVLAEDFIESVPHTDLVTSLSDLRYYKLNKPVRAGELLKKHDLTALPLVKAGSKTEIVIENSLLRLKTTGVSRSHGSIGEIVEVFNPQKNKRYVGKVIDINKVLVEL